MAATITSTDWSTNINKRASVQAFLQSKAKIKKVKVTVGAADTYATNGYAANVLSEAGISTAIAVIPEYTDSNLVFFYNKSTNKILCLGQGADGTAAGVLTELANASTAIQNKVFEFLVIGI